MNEKINFKELKRRIKSFEGIIVSVDINKGEETLGGLLVDLKDNKIIFEGGEIELEKDSAIYRMNDQVKEHIEFIYKICSENMEIDIRRLLKRCNKCGKLKLMKDMASDKRFKHKKGDVCKDCRTFSKKVSKINSRVKSKEVRGHITLLQFYDMIRWFSNEEGEFNSGYAGRKQDPYNSHFDHCDSLFKKPPEGGFIWNLVPVDANVNSSKGKKNMYEWYLKQDFFDEKRLRKIEMWQGYAFSKYGEEMLGKEEFAKYICKEEDVKPETMKAFYSILHIDEDN
ncbi:MAG: hypothetical protein Q4B63_08035 [Clostridium perfringens]|nr:hypothetical protein [Clostridium perfringens]